MLVGALVACSGRDALAQQTLGHKLLGSIGIGAGAQPEPGVHIADRVLYYSAQTLVDRDGVPIPVGFSLDAFGNTLGVGLVVWLPFVGAYLNVTFAVPIARISSNTTRPEASIDRFGLGDAYLRPLGLGWVWPHVDVVTSYAIYAPTGRLQGPLGLGNGHWTHEISAGGAAYFDDARTWRLSALASLDLNHRKLDVDITRGATVQIQGGFGVRLGGRVDVGVAGYALWQVTNDTGSALPPVLAGARERVFGLGPELGLLVPELHLRINARYAHDFGARSRPEGQVVVVGVDFLAWEPDAPDPS